MQDMPASDTVRIDMISDVVCPWCFVAFRQLERAIAAKGASAQLVWHPFELNPEMPAEGQNRLTYMTTKYGMSVQQAQDGAVKLLDLGETLGIRFVQNDQSRIHNTFLAHQLLDFALSQGLQHPLKLALFSAYFESGRDVSDPKVLMSVALQVGLAEADIHKVLTEGGMAQSLRAKQSFWAERGVTAVPTTVFDAKYMTTGAQGADGYASVLDRIAQDRAA